jgi:hypothetical protein
MSPSSSLAVIVGGTVNKPGVLRDSRKVPTGPEANEPEVSRGPEPGDATSVGRCVGEEPGAMIVSGAVPKERLGDGSGVIASSVEVRVGIIGSGIEATAAPVSIGKGGVEYTDVELS